MKNSKKVQPIVAEIEEPEMIIISDENNTSEHLVEDVEIINEFDNTDDVTLEVTDDDLDFTEPLDEDDLPFDDVKTPPVKDVALAEKNLRKKVLTRSINAKKSSISMQQKKVSEWRQTAKERDNTSLEIFEKRKQLLEELLVKNQLKYNKSIEKTKVWWWDYSETFTKVKIAKLQNDLLLLEKELEKLEIVK